MGTGHDAVAPTEELWTTLPQTLWTTVHPFFFIGGALETGFLCVLELAVLELTL